MCIKWDNLNTIKTDTSTIVRKVSYARSNLDFYTLILESEWSTNPKAIMEDFQKLLLGKAHCRVIIFEQETRNKVEQIISNLESQIVNFKGTQIKEGFVKLLTLMNGFQGFVPT